MTKESSMVQPSSSKKKIEYEDSEEALTESSSSSLTIPYLMFENLSLQPWHEIGNYEEERSISSTTDKETMVEQITAILASRLQDVVAHRVSVATNDSKKGAYTHKYNNDNDAVEEYYRQRSALKSDVVDNLKEYVRQIGDMYHKVPFHTFEHATHVTVSANKLLSMMLGMADMGCYSAEEDKKKHTHSNNNAHNDTDNDEQELHKSSPSLNCNEDKPKVRRPRSQSMTMIAAHASHIRSQLNISNITNNTTSDNANTSEAAANRAHQATFGISSDPLLRFALVFSALIHDVDHHGVPNATLVDEEHDLAIIHNDVSVAEQNSLHVAFSLIGSKHFKLLKSVIMPDKGTRKYFRKAVIHVVLQTDISNTQRMQIAQSQWKEAFPNQHQTNNSNNSSHQSSQQQQQQQQIKNRMKSQQTQRSRSLDNSSNNSSSTNTATNNNTSSTTTTNNTTQPTTTNNFHRSKRRSMHAIRTPYHKLSPPIPNNTQTFGIRKSLDFTGKVFEAYDTSIEGTRKLRQDAVMYTLITVADVAHTMQSFSIFVKWNERLFRELLSAYHNDRLSWDPTLNWYNNQIGFYDSYILPLAEKMAFCGVFGAKGSIFLYFAMENRRRWVEDGMSITEGIVKRAARDMMNGNSSLC